MKTEIFKTSPQSATKMAGLLYFGIAVIGGTSIGYIPTVLFVDGDAAQTAQNIAEKQGLFRLGILFDIAVIFMEILLTSILFSLTQPVSETLARSAAWARLSMVMIMAVNLMLYMVAALLLSGNSYLDVFNIDQLQALALLFFDAHAIGVYAWGLLFGLHLLLLGYLVIKSGYFPKVLGWMMLIGSFGYIIEALGVFVMPNADIVAWIGIGLLVIVTLGEISFALWLLIKGLNVEAWEART